MPFHGYILLSEYVLCTLTLGNFTGFCDSAARAAEGTGIEVHEVRGDRRAHRYQGLGVLLSGWGGGLLQNSTRTPLLDSLCPLYAYSGRRAIAG